MHDSKRDMQVELDEIIFYMLNSWLVNYHLTHLERTLIDFMSIVYRHVKSKNSVLMLI